MYQKYDFEVRSFAGKPKIPVFEKDKKVRYICGQKLGKKMIQRNEAIEGWLEARKADKNVLSVSLGSSKRNSQAEVDAAQIKVGIFRVGLDGSFEWAKALLEGYDGDSRISAFGLGGIDLWLGKKKSISKRAQGLIRNIRNTPIFDGWGLKNTMERGAIQYLGKTFPLKRKTVFLVSGIERFGIAEELEKSGCGMIYGDLMFRSKLPLAIRSLKVLNLIAGLYLRVGSYLPFRSNYPVGDEQEKNSPRFHRFFKVADIIGGDFIAIKRYMPLRIEGKMVITNTTTEEDVAMLIRRGASTLVTTTPRIQGRTFGTNVMEAVFATILKERNDLKDYQDILDLIDYKPEIQKLD